MTYQVLARKYRPQLFSEVVGQDHITRTLTNALSAERLHHAYLFTGVRGTGKTTVARILAKALNCTNKSNEEPCSKCGPCTEIANGTSLDVQEIDGASNTGVDDVRELRERTKYLPSSGKYKIYIIDEVHMLSGSAFNALLKTLEEPPTHVIFIFATTEAHKIPATILSRCQRYDFRRIPAATISSTLKRIANEEKIDADEEALHLIAREATGSLRDAESLFDQAIAFSDGKVLVDTIKNMLGFLDRKMLFDLLGAIIARNPNHALAVLDELFTQGSDLGRFAMDVLELLRHLLVLTECGLDSETIDLTDDEIQTLKGLLTGKNGEAAAPELHQMFSLWYRIAEEVSRSPFPKMLLEVGIVRLCRVRQVKPIEEIITKLDAFMNSIPEIQEIKRETNTPVNFTRPQSPVKTVTVAPTFEPVISAIDVEIEKHWQEFMRWVVTERPQIASIFQNGTLVAIDDGVVKMSFENPLYADMLSEEDRKIQVETLFKTFFKRTMRLTVSKSFEVETNAKSKNPVVQRSEQKKEKVREALGSDIVRQAADILNAQIHDVKVDK